MGFITSKITLILGAIAITLILGLGSTVWYLNKVIDGKNLEIGALTVVTSLQNDTIDTLQNSIITQNSNITELQTKSNKAEEEARTLTSILLRHDLERLSYAKPGLIQTRINKGTNQVILDLEALSKESTFSE